MTYDASRHRRTRSPRLARKLRSLFPNPKLWAFLTNSTPVAGGILSTPPGLDRPEGIDVSPDGQYIAVANSAGHGFSIYDVRGGLRRLYRAQPSVQVSNSNAMRYAHGVAFSPCGSMLAVAARDSHAIELYAIQQDTSGRLYVSRRGGLQGSGAGLRFPSGVSFHPSENLIAVANRQNYGIALYRYSAANGSFHIEQNPFKQVTEQDLETVGLAAPHDVAFSADGKTLISCHKRWYKNPEPQKHSGIAVLPFGQDWDYIDLEYGNVIHQGKRSAHSVACHPKATTIALSYSRERVDLFQLSTEPFSLTLEHTITVYQAGRAEGPKGVAFSPNGSELLVSTELDQVLVFSDRLHDVVSAI